jgi:hypothetical protein
MVSPNFKWFWVTFQVVAEVSKGADYGKEFFVMDVIVKFGREHRFGVKGDWVSAVQGVGLFQDGAKGKVTGIGNNPKG